MKTIDTKKLLTEIETFTNERDWKKFHSLKNFSMALSVECSELLEIFQWMTEEQSNNVKNDSKAFTKVEEEVADVFYYLLQIANKADIDLETAVLKKMQKNREKYPVELSKGNAKKYTDL